MTAVERAADGTVSVRAAAYALDLPAAGGTVARLHAGGRIWAGLRLLAALDPLGGGWDETVDVATPEVATDGAAALVTVARTSTCWESAATVLACHDDRIEVRAAVRGRGRPLHARVLAGRAAGAALPHGELPSAAHFDTLFSPNPADPRRITRSATESAVIGVTGDGQPGRGHWFFTPAPLCYAVSAAGDPAARWLTFALVAPVEELTFTGWHYEAADGGFGFRLDYEGHTAVDGEFRTPPVVIGFGATDPYESLRRYAAPAPTGDDRPAWWYAPMFCGWGAQCHLARTRGGRAAEYSGADEYDGFLAHLEERGVVPGTVVLDDKWQRSYGHPDPDPDSWPDLPGWIAARHRRGQRVLLWWKAWDPEGLPAEWCVRDPAGRAVALDPEHPEARRALAATIRRMLSPDGHDADGLKIDFTADTPTGAALTHHGRSWGIALLHELLAVVYAAAKAAKPDALVVTHTPHPAFAGVTDMIRLNDMLRLDDPELAAGPAVVEQMRYRAAVVAATLPGVPIDTDDWCAPDRASWREYVRVKTALGVPALYYADHLDLTGEPLLPADYAALRESWSACRRGYE
ncbi:MAG: hypothetical protein ACJ73S_31455 [Mycobacteriales bacterium]